MLDVTLHGDHFKISKHVDDFTQEKFGGLDKYQPDAKSVKVTIRHEADRYKVLAELHHDHLDTVVNAHTTEDTVYEALKKCSELVRKQLRRQHSKQVKKH